MSSLTHADIPFSLTSNLRNDLEEQNRNTKLIHQGSNTTRFSRRDYNHRYYQMHKERIQQKKKSRLKTNVLELLGKGKSGSNMNVANKTMALLRYAEVMAFASMAFVMTYFLVKEAASFYLDTQESHLSAYLKAGMAEGIAILFSFSRGRSALLRYSQRIVVILLCGLTLWTMSGKLVRSAVQDSSRTRTVMQVITDLEGEEAQKAKLYEVMTKREWIGSARRYEKGLDSIRQRLSAARQELATLQKPNVIMNSLGILLAFRLLLVVANLICIHRVAECFSDEAMRYGRVYG